MGARMAGVSRSRSTSGVAAPRVSSAELLDEPTRTSAPPPQSHAPPPPLLKKRTSSISGGYAPTGLPRPPSRPVPPPSAYVLYNKQRSRELSGMPLFERAKSVGAEWRALDGAARQPYEAQAAALAAEAEAERAAYARARALYEANVLCVAGAAAADAEGDDAPSEMSGVRERIEATVAALHATPGVRVTAYELLPAVDDATILRAAEACGGPLPADVAAFYSSCGGLTLEWEGDEGSGDGGAIRILPLVEEHGQIVDLARDLGWEAAAVCADWEAALRSADEATRPRGRVGYDDDGSGGGGGGSGGGEGDSTRARFDGCRPFDLFEEGGCAALWPADPIGDAAPSVHLLLEEQGSAHHEALHPLGLSFGEYVGLALAARGLAGFQKALSFATNQSPEAARFLQRLPELFPDADVRLFLPRVPRK